MTYKFQERLRHCSTRMAEVNKASHVKHNNIDGQFIIEGSRSGTTYRYTADPSPVLLSAAEMGPGNSSLIRVEYQDFIFDVSELKELYPPEPGDRYTWNRQLYRVTSMGVDEPPYQHITTDNTRVAVHTIKSTSNT